MIRGKGIKLIFVLMLLHSCAHGKVYEVRLEDRTLLIDPKSADLIYPHVIEECKHPDRKVMRLCKKKRVIKHYDLNDEKVRAMLIHAGFRCQSKQRFKY